MECSKCHQQYDANMNACPYCGAPKENMGTVQQNGFQSQQQYQAPQPQPGQQYNAQQQYTQQHFQQQQYQAQQDSAYQREKGRATGSLVCGILSLVFAWGGILGIVLSIIAISLGVSAKNVLPVGLAGSAKAGMICGIIGLIVNIIAMIGSAIYESLLWYY